ncbi:hypothetical protein SO694_0034006 [Aureococcus anophagefferens]|uniref:Uncharacterized protein n=1 Tax=Aureococcus anophagefferens TaxID=44056 RepID=A0ABR1G596_AURAN
MAAVVVDPGPLARLSLRDDAGGVAGARESLDVGGDDDTKPWQRSGSYDFDRRPRRYPYRSRDAFVSTPPSPAGDGWGARRRWVAPRSPRRDFGDLAEAAPLAEFVEAAGREASETASSGAGASSSGGSDVCDEPSALACAVGPKRVEATVVRSASASVSDGDEAERLEACLRRRLKVLGFVLSAYELEHAALEAASGLHELDDAPACDAKPSDDELHEYDRLWDAFKVRDAAEARYGLPSELPEATWGAVARALDHDDGLAGSPGRKRPLPRVADRARSGIFVVDHFGHMYAARKVSGAFHHSSLTRGHCCRFAGTSTTRSSRTGAASASTSRRRRSAGY